MASQHTLNAPVSSNTSNAMTTSFHPNEVGLSDTNLPPSFWQLEPHSRYWGTRPLTNLSRGNQAILDDKGRPYKAFPDLPNQISVNLEDWRNQLYADRTDPRIGIRDLHIRMQPGPGDSLPSGNTLNMRRNRLRNELGIPCWSRPADTPPLIECLKHEQYSSDSIARNTSIPVHPTGLVVPIPHSLAATGGPPIVPTTLPLTYFTHGIDRPHVPSEVLANKLACIAHLQDIATEQDCCHWIFLENKWKPDAWSIKAKGQAHPRDGPEDITFPEAKPKSFPVQALEWVKKCVRTAAAKGEPTPVIDTLPEHAREWVQGCIDEGLAMAEEESDDASTSGSTDDSNDSDDSDNDNDDAPTDFEAIEEGDGTNMGYIDQVSGQLALGVAPTAFAKRNQSMKSDGEEGTTRDTSNQGPRTTSSRTSCSGLQAESGQAGSTLRKRKLVAGDLDQDFSRSKRPVPSSRPEFHSKVQTGFEPSRKALGKRKRNDEELDTDIPEYGDVFPHPTSGPPCEPQGAFESAVGTSTKRQRLDTASAAVGIDDTAMTTQIVASQNIHFNVNSRTETNIGSEDETIDPQLLLGGIEAVQHEIPEQHDTFQEQGVSQEHEVLDQLNTLNEQTNWAQQELFDQSNTYEPHGTEEIIDPDLQWAYLMGPGLDFLITHPCGPVNPPFKYVRVSDINYID